MRFAVQLSKTEIGYYAEMNCLRESGEKRPRTDASSAVHHAAFICQFYSLPACL